jgi:UDP-N-acetylmuramoyl-tripeptide--D-alanyl-D-alanine ligase
VSGIVALIGPLGLSLRGRTSKLVWTRRLRVLAAVSAAVLVVVALVGLAVGIGPALAALAAVSADLVVDAGLAITKPFEQRAARRFVAQAAAALDRVGPTRVAITGSYGKTTTKGYVRHLVEGTRSVLASPASFNNTGGLSRAVNENLTPGTEVFVAEMGTYGRGEITEMCTWVRPDIGAIVAIGPVHLERMRSLDEIVLAKSEIAAAPAVVLNVDAHGLAALADELAPDRTVVRVSTGQHADADVLVLDQGDGHLDVHLRGALIASITAADAQASNVGCAVAIADLLGVPADRIAQRLPGLPSAEHRRQVVTTPRGVTVVDDTYNSNPAGAAAALTTLLALPARRRVVVTPGMVELGSIQDAENRVFAADAAGVVDDIVVVGRTNRAALLEGARAGRASVVEKPHREAATAWVRAELGDGDAVLYENDLPDHYP